MSAPTPNAPATPAPSPETQPILAAPGIGGSPSLKTSQLIGLDQAAATHLFGTATQQSDEPPATVWRYKNGPCELDLFFYLDLRSGQMRTLHYSLTGDESQTAKHEDCLKSLLVARSN
jgi:hypothetical protein